MNNLEPCPFCGEKDFIEFKWGKESEHSMGIYEVFMECENCGCRGQVAYCALSHPEAVDVAHAEWNQRSYK